MKKSQSRKAPDVILELKQWLKIEGNTLVKLASLLGYQTTGAVSVWLSRKKIPVYRREDVLRAINGEKECK